MDNSHGDHDLFLGAREGGQPESERMRNRLVRVRLARGQPESERMRNRLVRVRVS